MQPAILPWPEIQAAVRLLQRDPRNAENFSLVHSLQIVEYLRDGQNPRLLEVMRNRVARLSDEARRASA
jgi:hypothetical protein